MAEVKGKRKIYFSKGTGKVYSKDLRDPVVHPGKFSKKSRGLKATIAENYYNNTDWQYEIFNLNENQNEQVREEIQNRENS